MRIASKNEVMALMGTDVFKFGQFCLTPEGAVTNWLFSQLTNQDLDLEVFQYQLQELHIAGIFSAETLARFAAFGTIPGTPEYQPNLRTWRLPSTVTTIPEYIEFISPYLVFTNERNVSCSQIGEFSLDGSCNHPDAVEVI